MADIILKNDFDLAVEIIHSAAVWREELGYPTGSTWAAKDATKEGLLAQYKTRAENFFVMYVGGNPVLATIFQEHDGDGMWGALEDEERHYYLFKLAAKPENHGKGYADMFISYLKEKAIAEGVASIRLDTGRHQPGLIKLYEKNGFQELASIRFKQSGLEWLLMEWSNPNIRA